MGRQTVFLCCSHEVERFDIFNETYCQLLRRHSHIALDTASRREDKHVGILLIHCAFEDYTQQETTVH